MGASNSNRNRIGPGRRGSAPPENRVGRDSSRNKRRRGASDLIATRGLILAADVGNTNIVLGVFNEGTCIQFWRVSSDVRRTDDEYELILRGLLAGGGIVQQSISAVVIGSVVPILSQTIDAALARVTGKTPFHVTHQVRMPVANRYANANEVGIDRLANAAGGVLAYGAPLIIVDLGTAVTVDVVSSKAEYLGGAILPGIEMSAEVLSRRTARLPLTSAVPVDVVIGKTTVESIRSGLFHGMVGAVDYLVRRIWDTLGYRSKVVATGGLAPVIISESRVVRVHDPELTLRGLIAIYQMNCATSKRG